MLDIYFKNTNEMGMWVDVVVEVNLLLHENHTLLGIFFPIMQQLDCTLRRFGKTDSMKVKSV